MQTSSELLITKILEDLNALSKENKDILQQLYQTKLLDTEQSAEIKALQEKIKYTVDSIEQLQSQINAIEKSRIEISGFAKYIKIFWGIIIAVSSYLISIGLHK